MWRYSFFGAVARLVLIGWSVLMHQESELQRHDGKWFYCICSTVNSRTFLASCTRWETPLKWKGQHIGCPGPFGNTERPLDVNFNHFRWILWCEYFGVLLYFFCSVQTHLKFGKDGDVGAAWFIFWRKITVCSSFAQYIKCDITLLLFYFYCSDKVSLLLKCRWLSSDCGGRYDLKIYKMLLFHFCCDSFTSWRYKNKKDSLLKIWLCLFSLCIQSCTTHPKT